MSINSKKHPFESNRDGVQIELRQRPRSLEEALFTRLNKHLLVEKHHARNGMSYKRSVYINYLLTK